MFCHLIVILRWGEKLIQIMPRKKFYKPLALTKVYEKKGGRSTRLQ
nr:hypothetical protein [uncultured archaeon]